MTMLISQKIVNGANQQHQEKQSERKHHVGRRFMLAPNFDTEPDQRDDEADKQNDDSHGRSAFVSAIKSVNLMTGVETFHRKLSRCIDG